MPTPNHEPALSPAMLMRKNIGACQHDAVKLNGLIYALDLLINEGVFSDAYEDRAATNAAVSLCMIARDLSERLADDLDGVCLSGGALMTVPGPCIDCNAWLAALAEVLKLPEGSPERRQRLQAVAADMPMPMAHIIARLPDPVGAD